MRFVKRPPCAPSLVRPCTHACVPSRVPSVRQQRAELRKAAREVSNIDRFETSGLSNTGVTIMLEAILKNIEERTTPS